MVDAADNGPDTARRTFAGEPVSAIAAKYMRAFSGDGARLFIQLFYFYLVANTLSIADFGLFATASSIGIVLSRVAGFGFLSPLYRVATVKPRLIGTYTAGLLAAVALSLPLIAAIGIGVHAIFFAGSMTLATFAMIILSEVVFWRALEVVIAVTKGLERFGRASIIIIFGFSMKALGALAFALGSDATLERWALIYVLTQGAMAILAIAIFYPRVRLRFEPKLYMRRLRDALAVSGAEILFYVQAELDKLVVLSIGGDFAAGLYAIVMRLADLTAMPVRVASTLITQRLMRRPDMLNSWRVRLGFEAAVFIVSTAGLLAMALVFWIKPDVLGENVARATPFIIAIALVPAFRNLVEYHAELLYGRGQTTVRLVNYALIGALKAGLLVLLMASFTASLTWFAWLNGLFFALYALSLVLTYAALKRPAVRI